MTNHDRIIFLGVADDILASDDPADVPADYFRRSGERWRTALQADRLRSMQALDADGALPEPWKSELDAARAAVAAMLAPQVSA